MPYVLDDARTHAHQMDGLKNFMEVSSEDPKAYARWGAAAFAKQQHRQLTTNTYLPGAEPMKIDAGKAITHEQFVELISPSFANNSNSVDIEALLKRANIVVLGKHQVYIRLAQLEFEAVDVPVVQYVHGVSLLASDKSELKKYREGVACSDTRLEAGIQWSLKFIKKVLDEEELEFTGDSLTVA
eukprot:1075707-Amphidinium_carterae.1